MDSELGVQPRDGIWPRLPAMEAARRRSTLDPHSMAQSLPPIDLSFFPQKSVLSSVRSRMIGRNAVGMALAVAVLAGVCAAHDRTVAALSIEPRETGHSVVVLTVGRDECRHCQHAATEVSRYIYAARYALRPYAILPHVYLA